MTRAECLAELERRGISYEVEEHPPVHTIEEMRELGILDHGTVGKNLFLRNEKGNKHYLVLVHPDKSVDLKALRTKIGSTRLSFGSEDRLMKQLKLTQGAVSPLGLLNNEDHSVTWIVDSDLVSCGRLGVHPLDNEATVWLASSDLVTMVKELGNPVQVVQL